MTESSFRKGFDGKQAYQSPSLRVYGDIRIVTQTNKTATPNADAAKAGTKTH